MTKRAIILCVMIVTLNVAFLELVQAVTFTQLTTDPNGDFSPDWSPLGDKIAFVSYRTWPYRIWVIPSTGGTEVQLSNLGTYGDGEPKWSPDANYILFESRNSTGRWDLYTMTSTGDNVTRRTYTDNRDENNPDWSPDGYRIVWTIGSTWVIVVRNLEGGTEQQLTSGVFPSWSPDGGWIAYNYQNDIYMISESGGLPTPLTTNPAEDFLPDWSPDGRWIAFTSNRSGNRDIWVMDSRGESFGLWQITTDSGEDLWPAWSPDGTRIVFQSDRSGNSDIWIASDLGIPGTGTLVLKDGSASHDPIANKAFKIYKVTNDPPDMTENYLGELTTDGNGIITLPDGWFNVGEWVKVERFVDTVKAVKHQTILPNMYYMKIDNGKFDTETGAISYHPLNSNPEQEVIIDHTTIMYDLLVTVEWDADLVYLDSLWHGFKRMSNYLYDVSDGQIYLNRVLIYDNRQNWDKADMQICASNALDFPWTDFAWFLLPIPALPWSTTWACIHMPRIWFGSKDDTRNKSFQYPIQLTSSSDYRTKAHEFAHYALAFGDEYKFWPPGESHCTEVTNYGFMDKQYDVSDNKPYDSEMSSDSHYVHQECQNTQQYVLFNKDKSCWADFESDYEKRYSDLLTPIIIPSERSLSPDSDYFPGPNDDFGEYPDSLNYNVGELLSREIQDYDGGARTIVVTCYEPPNNPKPKADVLLTKSNWSRHIYQGQTADPPDTGKIRCLGYNNGDWIRATERVVMEGKGTEHWLFGQGQLGKSGVSDFRNLYVSSLNGDTLDLFLRAVQGEYPLIFTTSLATGTLEYMLYTDQPFSANPTLELHPDDAPNQSYTLQPTVNGYSISVPDSTSVSGMFTMLALDDSAFTFFVNTPYFLTQMTDTSFLRIITGPQGGCELYLDTLNTNLEKILILSSSYPPIRTGLDPLSEQAGEVYSLSSYPGGPLLGSNTLIIRYADSDLKTQSEATLEIFKWNESLQKWEELCGFIDTEHNIIGAAINSLGIYAAFTTGYLSGDANGSGLIELGDVVYLITYLYKNGPAPVPLLSGDANCSGEVELGDVVYLITYLYKAGPPPSCK